MRAGDAQNRYETAREESFAITEERELALEEGPKAPYPIHFVAGCDSAPDSNCSSVLNDSDLLLHPDYSQFSLPAISLSVPDNIALKLHGYYFAWARHFPKQRKGKEKSEPVEISWVQAILSATLINISDLARVSVGQTYQKNFALRLVGKNHFWIHNFRYQLLFLLKTLFPRSPLAHMVPNRSKLS